MDVSDENVPNRVIAKTRKKAGRPLRLRGHPAFIFSFGLPCFSLGGLKAHACKERYHILRRVGQQHRDPMDLVHVVGGEDPVLRTEGAEHFCWQLEVYDVDDLVTYKAKLAPRYPHYDGVPLAAVRVP